MYNPYAREAGGSDKPVRYLNINKQITSLWCGSLAQMSLVPAA